MKVRCLLLLLLLSGLIPLSTGCRQKNSAVGKNPAADSQKKEADESQVLASTLIAMWPEEFDVDVPRDLPPRELNEWAQTAFNDNIDQDVDEDALRKTLESRLDVAQAEAILRRRYSMRDAVHIRDMLWARALMESVSSEGQNDLAKIVDLVQLVSDLLMPVADEAILPPLSPFEYALLGRGTPQARAWTLAVLLRQRRIPVLLVDIPVEDSAARKPMLVGVLLEKDVYLFDLKLGVPVPGPGDSTALPFIRRPAKLSEAIADDSMLRKLDLPERPWPVTSEKLKNATLRLIGDTSLWSRRMEALQNAASGSISAVVFEPLVSQGTLEGTFEYVKESLSGQVAEDKLGIWTWPEEQRVAAEQLSDEQKQQLAAITNTWRVPQPIQVDGDVRSGGTGTELKVAFQPGTGLYRRARTQQLMGQIADAIPTYLRIQTWDRLPPAARKEDSIPPEMEEAVIAKVPLDVRERHAQAAEEAEFWRATAQLQKGNHTGAAVDFEQYLRHRPTGRFAVEARFATAICLAKTGNQRRGVSFLKSIPETSPYSDIALLLIARWSEQPVAEPPASDSKPQ